MGGAMSPIGVAPLSTVLLLDVTVQVAEAFAALCVCIPATFSE